MSADKIDYPQTSQMLEDAFEWGEWTSFRRRGDRVTDSPMPLVDVYLAGDGNLDAAVAELISFMPLHGSLFGKDPVEPPPAEVEERGRVLMTRVRVMLAELREAGK